MPTGYTADVQDGKVTKFKDFALLCARAFGALIELRDEPMNAPLPDKFNPSDYHTEALESARNRLSSLRAMSPAKVEKEAQKAHAKLIKAHESYEAEKRLRRGRYEAMLEKVKDWTPPTKDHTGLKTFMKEQLSESIRFDCGFANPAPKAKSPEEWLTAEIERARNDVEYHTKHHAEEVERAEGRTDWLRQLRASLE